MSLNIIQDFIPAGRRNRPGTANPIRYITIHNTGNANKGANAKAHASYLKSDTANNMPVSWHYTVDSQGAYQHLPDAEIGYHAGDGAGPGNRQRNSYEQRRRYSQGDRQRGRADRRAVQTPRYFNG